MNRKNSQNIFQAIISVNLMVQNANQNLNKELCQSELKNPIKHQTCEKCYVLNLSRCACEIDKYIKNVIGDSAVICEEIIEMTKPISTKTVPTKIISTKLFQEFLTKKRKL